MRPSLGDVGSGGRRPREVRVRLAASTSPSAGVGGRSQVIACVYEEGRWMSGCGSSNHCRNRVNVTNRGGRGGESRGRIVAAVSVLDVREAPILRWLGLQSSRSVIWEGVRRREQMWHERERLHRAEQGEGWNAWHGWGMAAGGNRRLIRPNN